MSFPPPPPPPEHGGDQPTPPQGPTPPGYGTPYPGYPGYADTPRNSAKAVAALVIGIISPVLGLCCALVGLVGIAAIFLGRSARQEIAASGGSLTGEGMAKAGIILGIVGSVLGVLVTIASAAWLLSGNATLDFNTY